MHSVYEGGKWTFGTIWWEFLSDLIIYFKKLSFSVSFLLFPLATLKNFWSILRGRVSIIERRIEVSSPVSPGSIVFWLTSFVYLGGTWHWKLTWNVNDWYMFLKKLSLLDFKQDSVQSYIFFQCSRTWKTQLTKTK